MTVVFVLLVSIIVLGGGGWAYSRFLARRLGETPGRVTPAVSRADGRDFVATPTTVVFAHHFASIAGAGPLLGPVIAVIYGWVPALLWVLLGGLLIGAVHDYLATYMSLREGGESIATITRRMLGRDAFVAMTFFIVIMLALVCAAFLNLSAAALTSTLEFDRLGLAADQTLLRVQDGKAVIGGIASMSVVVITAVAPLLGWLYLKKGLPVWICSVLAIAICAVSITIGLFRPVAFPSVVLPVLGWTVTGTQIWMMLISAYVLIAAGVPVWIFLQSRDFINVHILYVGMAALLATLVVGGLRGAGSPDPLPAFNITEGTRALGMFWPTLFIVIACGAVSGFHSLCAGGTTCKQLRSEPAARRVGYNAMVLESFLAACVIAALLIGARKTGYVIDVHPALAGLKSSSNPILGFAMAIGQAGSAAFGVPIVVGALAGMVLFEGFVVTTLDTAIRLTRYLIEEIWRTFFGHYDVFAGTIAPKDAQRDWGTGEKTPVGADGIPIAPPEATRQAPVQKPVPTRGAFRALLKVLRLYWVNSALAVILMLSFALTGGVTALWKIFATSNQLLAAMVLALGALWLLRQGRSFLFALIPAVAMLFTTVTNLVIMLRRFLAAGGITPLLVADVVIMAITAYLLAAGVREIVRHVRRRQTVSVTAE